MIPRSLAICAFQARHFKPFVDTGWVRLRPITIIFGHNSSGKSALLSVLPMLKQTLEDPNLETPLVLSSDAGVDLGAFEDVAHRHEVSISSPIWLNLELLTGVRSPNDPARRFARSRLLSALRHLQIETDTIRIELAANYNKKQRTIALTQFRLSDHSSNTILRMYRKTTAAAQPWHFEPPTLEESDVMVSWRHFLPRLILQGRTTEPDPYFDLTTALTSYVTADLRTLVHIGPLRAFPIRAYRLTGESPRDVGELGQNWLGLLLRSSSRGRLTDKVNQWLQRLGYTLTIEWGKQGYVHPLLKDENGLQVSLKDVGFGISQVLPLLIQGFSSPPGTILILEQPEIHLHPRAQAEIADIIIAIAKRGIHLLVETHSEHILLRLQRRIAESALNPQDQAAIAPEDASLYFIQRTEGSSTVHELDLSPSGDLKNPPAAFEAFFSDDYQEVVLWTKAAAQIAKAQPDADSH